MTSTTPDAPQPDRAEYGSEQDGAERRHVGFDDTLDRLWSSGLSSQEQGQRSELKAS